MRRACSSAFSAASGHAPGSRLDLRRLRSNSPRRASRSALRAASRCLQAPAASPRASGPWQRRCRRRRRCTPRRFLRVAAFISALVFSAISAFDSASHLLRQTISGFAASTGAIGLELGADGLVGGLSHPPACRRPDGSARRSARHGRGSGRRGRRLHARPRSGRECRRARTRSRRHAHHAELRMQGGEGIVGDLRPCRAMSPPAASICRHWAGRPARHRRSASAAATASVPRPASRDRRGAAPGWWRLLKCALPQPPIAALGTAGCAGPAGSGRADTVSLSSSRICVPTGTLDDQVLAAGAAAVLAHAVMAALAP